jgi:hypothetical protein
MRSSYSLNSWSRMYRWPIALFYKARHVYLRVFSLYFIEKSQVSNLETIQNNSRAFSLYIGSIQFKLLEKLNVRRISLWTKFFWIWKTTIVYSGIKRFFWKRLVMKEWKWIEASNFAEQLFLYYTLNWFNLQVWKILLDFLIQSWIFP